MDDKEITEEETNIALRLAAGSRIAYITVLAHSRTDKELPRTLSLASSTEILMETSRNKPVKLSEDDKLWFAKVILTLSKTGSSIGSFCSIIAAVYSISSQSSLLTPQNIRKTKVFLCFQG